MSFTEFLNEKRILEELGAFPDKTLKASKFNKFLVVEYYDDKDGIRVRTNRGKVLTEHDKGRFEHADMIYHFLDAHGHNMKLEKIP